MRHNQRSSTLLNHHGLRTVGRKASVNGVLPRLNRKFFRNKFVVTKESFSVTAILWFVFFYGGPMSPHPTLAYTMPGSALQALLQRARRYSLLLLLALAWMGLLPRPAHAQVMPFTITGHIQKFTEDTPCLKYGGAHITVNGLNVRIPANTVLVMPAAYFTVDQLFAGPHGTTPCTGTPRQSLLAMADIPAPIAAFEANIIGNIVNGEYRAGLVYLSQQSVNTSDGFIKAINYGDGVMCVGSTPGALPFSLCADPIRRNALVRINDPLGRYGQANPSSLPTDPRFSVDPDNPTIHAANGYPMCVPRFDPAVRLDTACPIANRKDPATGQFFPTHQFIAPIPDQQVPFIVGDYITFSGTLAKMINGTIFVSAHTIDANVAAFTQLPTIPYVFMEKSKLGAGPTVVCPGAECQNRIVVIGFTTDPSQTPNIGVHALDVDPATGNRTTRKLLVPSIRQAVIGRFRLEILKSTQLLDSINPNGGTGATRELLFRWNGPQGGNALPDGSPVPDAGSSPTRANGLVAGQYWAPTFEYLFGEPQPGGVPPPFNFQCLEFLSNGWAIKDPLVPANSLLNIGQLSPWPGATPPATVNCKTP